MKDDNFWLAIDKLISTLEIVIDRPRGSKHPIYGFIYKIDYGYLSNTKSQDSQWIDVWKGSLRSYGCDAIICTVDLIKRDSEIKNFNMMKGKRIERERKRPTIDK